MNKLTHALILAGLLGAPVFAIADAPAAAPALTGNIGFTTDYIFRGVTQTQHEPAIQGGFDYAHSSGFYVGTWASNVAWVSQGYKDNNSMEIDLYGGYKGSMGDFGYDIGAITYYYPGKDIPNVEIVNGVANPDTTEVYLGGSWKFLSVKYSHVVSDHFIGWLGTNGQNTRNSNYIELNGNYDLGNGWGVLGHVGHQKVENLSDADYSDWKLGVSKDIGFGVVTLAYSDTNADSNLYVLSGKKIADGRAMLSFAKTF